MLIAWLKLLQIIASFSKPDETNSYYKECWQIETACRALKNKRLHCGRHASDRSGLTNLSNALSSNEINSTILPNRDFVPNLDLI